MRVKFLEGAAGGGVAYYPGDVADIEDGLAKRWIAGGTCEPAKLTKSQLKRVAAQQNAVNDQRELAVGR